MADQLYSKSVDSVNYDNLISGDNVPIQTKGVTVASGQGALVRGTVLGQIKIAVGAPAAGGGNTGDGTVTGVSLGKKAKIGTYTLKCVTAAANGGTFSVVGPDGEAYADAVVGSAYAGPLNFTINDGAADFVVGDTFTIAVAAGSEKHVKVNSANTDGSGEADCILTDDIDATSADVVITAYTSGPFNRKALVFGGTDDASDHEAVLRQKGIFLKDNIAY